MAYSGLTVLLFCAGAGIDVMHGQGLQFFLRGTCCLASIAASFIPFTRWISMSGRQDETFELKSPEDYFFSGAVGEFVEVRCHDLIHMIP